jgi:hypothetical protein
VAERIPRFLELAYQQRHDVGEVFFLGRERTAAGIEPFEFRDDWPRTPTIGPGVFRPTVRLPAIGRAKPFLKRPIKRPSYPTRPIRAPSGSLVFGAGLDRPVGRRQLVPLITWPVRYSAEFKVFPRS